MKRFIMNLLGNEKVRLVGLVLGTFLICMLTLLYFLQADISQAPQFVYSQF